MFVLKEVKLHRDQLIGENQTLAEANRRYHMHTTELKDRVETFVVCTALLLSNYLKFTKIA